ncbi:MAG TPA: DUF4382 domain-containing protein [Terriglobales bacterium]|nr:DUF4382 domain-containing protein [Terriglobales bacterium]
MRKAALWILAVTFLLAIALLLSGCGGGNSAQKNQMATVNLTISDPPTCGAVQGGMFKHIYVTVRDVKIHTSGTAGANDAGWVDLTPSLSAGAPMQIDLLGISDNNCFLAMLGSRTEIQPGTYQQIRVYLADSGTAPSNGDQCGGGFNCVVLNDGNNTVSKLQLSSEAQTGIKIPSGQLAGGAFTVMPGETKDLNIDFNACASIVREGNGKFRLKPVLHAGVVKLTSQSINGTVVDSQTKQPIVGNVVVALEQKDASGVSRVIMETKTDATGKFAFCPVPAGMYEVVAVAVDDKGVAYSATVTSGVQPGNALGNIELFAQTGTSTAPATVKGTITSSTGSAGVAVDVVLSALQQVKIGTMDYTVTVPLALQNSTTMTVTTAAGQCPSNTNCIDYAIALPAANATGAAFSATGTTYAANPTTPVNYTIEGAAFKSPANDTPTCTQPVLTVNKLSDGTNPLAVTAGNTFTAQTLAFNGCQ